MSMGYEPAVYAPRKYTIHLDKDKPNGKSLTGIVASQKDTAESREIEI